MKKYLIFLLLFITNIIYSQVIITIPEFPTEQDSIVIIFNAKEATRNQLVGYSGDLYAHTGVNTNLGQWRYVIESWGNNSTQPKLTRIDEDLYELAIGHPRDFYSITNSGEQILQLNFVFRSADANLQTEDIFVDIYEPGLKVKFVQPQQKNSIIKIGNELLVVAFASQADSLLLYIGDERVAQTDSDSIAYTISVDEKIKKTIIAVAKKSEEFIADTVYYIGREDNIIQELPAGINTGINYTSSTNVTLALFAPDKEYVYVIGDFNDWEIETSFELKLTPDSTIWWIELSDLNPKEEYAFQYLVSENILIADPYADKVLEKGYDAAIPDEIYPNLKPYPESKTSEIVSIFQTDQTPYEWQVEDFERPAKTDLVIYELLIRDFLEDHSFKTLSDTLSYFKNLGVNAIELMPVIEFERNSNWGYEPSFQFAVDKYYGTKNDLKRFIDECHSMGIAVIFDVVLNHIYGRSPFVRLYNEGGYGRPTPDNPWLNPEPRHPFNVGYDFNHESPYTKQLVDRFNKYWLQEYNIDGFRFDLSKGMTQTYSGDNAGLMAQYDQSRIDILTRMADEIRTYDSTAYLILEHFADNSEETVLANFGFMIWGNLNEKYNEATMGYNEDNKSNIDWGSYKTRGWNDPHLVTYMESHDEERLMFKNIAYGNFSDGYNAKDTTTALNRMKLASAFFYTIPGPKMIWKFGELGYDYSKFYDMNTNTVVLGNDGIKLDRKPIRWDYLDDPNRLNLFKVNKALISLKKNYDVFRTTNFSLAVSGPVKRIKLTHESMNVVIIGNFDVVTRNIIPSFHTTGKWYDYFSGDSTNVENTQFSIQLAPGEFHIYSSKKLPTPEDDILLDIDQEFELMQDKFSLAQNYPNPFNPVTTIEYSITSEVRGQRSEGKNVTLKIYDILGRELVTLVNEKQNPGNYVVDFNPSADGLNLSSGIYFYRLKTDNFIQTKKMMMVK